MEELIAQTVESLAVQLKERYHLINLNIALSPTELLEGSKFDKKSAEVVYTKLDMEFSAISDHLIYGFIEEFNRNIPGMIHINSFTLEREQNKPIDDDVLLDLGQGRMRGVC